MKVITMSYTDIKAVYGNVFSNEQELRSMPLPGATCSVIAGATTSCCTSCCFAN